MKNSKIRNLLSSLLVIGASLCGQFLMAQSGSTGALTINVTDPSGAVIAGAAVKVNNGGAVTRSQTTAANGSYTFTLLPPGTYEISILAEGFQSVTVPGVEVNVTEVAVLNQSLKLGVQAEQVTVSATVESAQTQTSALGSMLSQTELANIPLATRNYTQLIDLSPGVVTGVTDASAFGRGSSASIYVNGHDDASNSYLMDGVQVSSYSGSTTEDSAGSYYGSIPIPSPDSLQEFRIVTSMHDASIGRNPGASITLISKTGTNRWHGSLFEFFRNDAFNANTFFANLAGHPRGELKQNQYGGSLGGPIKKDKFFFFLSYQGMRQLNGVSSQGTSSVTLPAALTNDRSAPALGAEFCHSPTFPATTGVANPASDQVACDGSNINPVSLKLLNAKLPDGTYLIPSPQLILSNGTGFSYYSIPAPFHDEQVSFNLDYVASEKNTVSGRYFFDWAPNTNEFTSSTQPPGSPRKDLQGNELFSLKLTSLPTPSLVNEARVSSYYIRADRWQQNPLSATAFGMAPALPSYDVLPVISITGGGGFGGGQTDTVTTPVLSLEWADQVSWNHGRHSFHFGYDQQYNKNDECNCGKTRGTLSFQTFSDFLLGMSGAQNGTTLSNISTSTSNAQLFSQPDLARENNMGLFAQDDFRVSPRLTLNLGLRWEYDGTGFDSAPYGGTNANWSLFETVPIPPTSGTLVGFTVSKDYTGQVPDGVVRRSTNLLTDGHAPWNNFAPRVGFAWQPLSANGRFVIRGGSGIFYKLIDSQHFLNTWTGTPPIAVPFNHSAASNSAATFAVPFTPAIQLGTFSYFLRTPTSAITTLGTDPNLITPRTLSWNLETQYAITPTLLMELGYVGQHSVHTEAGGLEDIPILATASAPVNCGAPSGCITTNTSANAAQREPVLGFTPGGYSVESNIGNSTYDALQASLRKTFSKGLQFQAAYTWDKCLSNYTGSGTAASGQGGSVAYNITVPGQSVKGQCGYDRAQRFVVSYQYTLPSPHGLVGVPNKLLSGWTVAGVTTAQIGTPITLTDSRAGQVYGALGTASASSTVGANLCPGETYGDILSGGPTGSRLTSYFNSGVFCAPPIVGVVNGVGGATGYGNVGLNPVHGPGQFNWDISLQKKTIVGGLAEDAELEFRTDFFNAFNHSQFSNPSSNVGSASTFGVITTTTVGPRIMQFALKYRF